MASLRDAIDREKNINGRVNNPDKMAYVATADLGLEDLAAPVGGNVEAEPDLEPGRGPGRGFKWLSGMNIRRTPRTRGRTNASIFVSIGGALFAIILSFIIWLLDQSTTLDIVRTFTNKVDQTPWNWISWFILLLFTCLIAGHIPNIREIGSFDWLDFLWITAFFVEVGTTFHAIQHILLGKSFDLLVTISFPAKDPNNIWLMLFSGVLTLFAAFGPASVIPASVKFIRESLF